jgi:hypothetical protein
MNTLDNDDSYSNGKIYTIRCKNNDSLIYVGSTKKSLEERLKYHKNEKRDRRLYKYINNDWDNWEINLHLLYPCNSKKELTLKEGEIIREIGTLNIVINGRTHKEWFEDNKEYQKQKNKEYRENPINRERILQQKRDDYQKRKNTEQFINNSKKYREEHKDTIIDNVNEWRKKNPDKVKGYREKSKEYMKQYCKEYYKKKKEEKIKLKEEQQTL